MPPPPHQGMRLDLFDVNSDGLPDLLVTAPGLYGDNYAAFIGGYAGATDQFGPDTEVVVDGVLGADAGVLTLNNQNVVPLDLDGDGHVNLLHMPQAQEYALYSFVPDGDIFRLEGRVLETASREDVKIDFTNRSAVTKSADVNFDGLVDIVVSTGTEIQTFFSLGRYPGGDGQFGQAWYDEEGELQLSNDPMTSCLPWSAEPIQFSDPDVRLADMNGDGVVDIVRMRPGQLLYWPGRGNGYFGTGDRTDCGEYGYSQDRHVAMADAPFFTHSDAAALRVDDVNGDGLDDLVQVRFDGVDVWLNSNGIAWAERRIIDGTPAAQNGASRVRLVDINGSGTRDLLWGDGYQYRYIDLQGGARPRLLSTIDSGVGKTTVIEYESSTEQMLRARRTDPDGVGWTRKMPLVTQVVKRHIDRDNLGDVAGLHAREYITEYTYRNPVYDGQQREFRGFSRTDTRNVGDANSPTSVTISAFLLGECVDEDEGDAVDTCAVSERWRDNPREALKGLELLSETRDESHVFYNTTHNRYRLRRLYSGLDGRDVRHAFKEYSTTLLYDHSPFVETPDATIELPAVVVEIEPGQVLAGSGPEDVTAVHTRATSGMASLGAEVRVDEFGNQTATIAHGCISGGACPRRDERISNFNVTRALNTPDHWLFRSTRSFVRGQANRGPGHGTRRDMRVGFDAFGAPTVNRAVLDGTLELDRFRRDSDGEIHSVPGEDVAAAPSDASPIAKATIVVGRMHYDDFGNTTLTRAANGRCAAAKYDDAYALFVTAETLYPGGCGDIARRRRPQTPTGGAELFTAAAYDHGLGLPTVVIDMQGQYTRALYDEFGRITAVYRPHPGEGQDSSSPVADPLDPTSTSSVGVCSLPSSVLTYDVATKTRPYSIIHTKTQDGANCGDDEYSEAYAFIDGFGRTLFAATEGDPATDGHAWVAGGVVEYDAKGAVRRKYLSFYLDDAPRTTTSRKRPTRSMEASDTMHSGELSKPTMWTEQSR